MATRRPCEGTPAQTLAVNTQASPTTRTVRAVLGPKDAQQQAPSTTQIYTKVERLFTNSTSAANAVTATPRRGTGPDSATPSMQNTENNNARPGVKGCMGPCCG